MSLYNNEVVMTSKFSQEEFKDYYNKVVVISSEAMSDFFFKLKDSFNTIQTTLLNIDRDKAALDTLSTRFETEHVISRLKYIDIKDELVDKPENFKGKYVDYIKDLISSSDEVLKNTESTLNNLKLAISSFINEYTEDKVHTLYGGIYFKEADKIVDKHQKEISKYFPKANSSVKAYLGDLLKSLNDVPNIYSSIQTLEEIINERKIDDISKLANEASSLVDVLIEQNKTSGILLKNNTVKKELVDALHIAAKEVEFLNYLYSNIIFFYASFKKMSDILLAKGKE